MSQQFSLKLGWIIITVNKAVQCKNRYTIFVKHYYLYLGYRYNEMGMNWCENKAQRRTTTCVVIIG